MTGLVIDNFAGGGGASTGIEAALGRAVDVAINHDEAAVAVTTAHLAQHNTERGDRVNPGQAADRPLSTVTGKGTQQQVVETVLIEADALPPEQMARAVQVAAFLVKYYGNEIDAHGLAAPIGTVTTRDRFAVVTVTLAQGEGDPVTFVLVDIGMRMLEPRELSNAQGFPPDYILDPVCWYLTDGGNRKFGRLPKSQQIAKIGNAVCPPMSEALVRANLPCAAIERVAA